MGSERGSVLGVLAGEGLVCPLRKGYTHGRAGRDPYLS